MSEDKCGYDDSIVEDSALGLMDFKSDCNDQTLGNVLSDDDKDPEDDPSWSFTGTTTAGDKFEADMDASWVTMRLISHFISVTQPDLEEFLLAKMDEYFILDTNSSTRGESKECDFTSQQYEIYQSYCNMFEDSMSDFTDEHSKEEIIKTLKASNHTAESGHETMGTILLDMLEALADFKEFHLMFIEKRDETMMSPGTAVPSSENKK